MSIEQSGRGAYFVGSFPAESAEVAVRECLEGAQGMPIRALSDGETGQRGLWIGRALWAQLGNPNVKPVQTGNYTNYDDTHVFEVEEDQELPPESLGLDYSSYVLEGLDLIQRERVDYGRPDLRLQVGIPGPVDHAYDIFRVREGSVLSACMDATVTEVNKISGLVGRDGIIQIETPESMVYAIRNPRQETYARMAHSLAELARQAPEDTAFAVHFCLGDMNNKSQTDAPLESAAPVVGLTKALMRLWPNKRHLQAIHFPLAGGDHPALQDPQIIDGLGELRDIVPPDTAIAAGLVHEGATFAEQRDTLHRLEASLDRQVEVGTACGLARRDLPAARYLMGCMRALSIA